MKSNKQKRLEIRKRRAQKVRKAERQKLEGLVSTGQLVPVSAEKLDMGNSWDCPPQFYADAFFHCRDCGSEEVWTAKQQKWWFEVIGSPYYRKAARCRPCRIKERIRKSEARRVHLEGLRRKRGDTVLEDA